MNLDDVGEERRRGTLAWGVIRERLEDGRITERGAADIVQYFRDRGAITDRWMRRIAARIATFVEEPRRNLYIVFEEAAEMEDWVERRPPVENTLRDIAADAQSVHRAAVSEQTNQMIQKLLNTQPTLCPEETFALAFRGLKRTTLLDIRKWDNTYDCIDPGDQLYRQLLNALMIRIDGTQSPVKEELIKRFQEEVTESVGTCCMGHITRLCNVLVGFDDAFQPQVSVGELLQEKIAAISQRDVSLEEKALDAWKAMDELHVPNAERNAWIDAL